MNIIYNALLTAAAYVSPVKANGLPGYDPTHPSATLATSTELHNVLQIVFGFVGALALLVITISGLRYVLSNGDPQRAARAKDGIIYALIGLVVAIFGEAIVAFVVKGVG